MQRNIPDDGVVRYRLNDHRFLVAPKPGHVLLVVLDRLYEIAAAPEISELMLAGQERLSLQNGIVESLVRDYEFRSVEIRMLFTKATTTSLDVSLFVVVAELAPMNFRTGAVRALKPEDAVFINERNLRARTVRGVVGFVIRTVVFNVRFQNPLIAAVGISLALMVQDFGMREELFSPFRRDLASLDDDSRNRFRFRRR